MTKFLNFKNIFLGIFLSLIIFSFALAATTPIENIQAKEVADSIVLTWDAVPEAASYKVFNLENNGLFVGGAVGNKTTFILANVEPDKTYRFAVRAYKAGASNYFAGGDKDFKTAPTVKSEPIKIGARFPNEPEEVSLIDHIYYAHRWASIVGSLVAVFMIIFAGFKYATSAGNPEALQDAKDTLIGALIGLAIIILTYVLLQMFGVRFVKETTVK